MGYEKIPELEINTGLIYAFLNITETTCQLKDKLEAYTQPLNAHGSFSRRTAVFVGILGFMGLWGFRRTSNLGRWNLGKFRGNFSSGRHGRAFN